MSKQSNKARKAARAAAARAVEDGDLEALKRLAETSPERAVKAVAVMLERGPDADTVTFATDLARRLRRRGQLEAAKSIGISGSSRSRRLALELAVTAFALGDDALAAQTIRGDAALEAIVGPLLQCTRGVSKERSGRAPSQLAGLFATSRAIAFARAGQHEEAAKAARSAPERTRGAVKLALDLAKRPQDELRSRSSRIETPGMARRFATTRKRAYDDLVKHPLCAPAVRIAAVLELAETLPRASMEIARRSGFGPDVLARVTCRAELRDAAAAARPEKITALAASAGVDAFEPADAASAWLYRGFGLLSSVDGRAANVAFERAIELGADLTEALRGRFLAAWQGATRCVECGHSHGEPSPIGSAAERLASAYAKIPFGKPYAAEAMRLAAEAWVDAGASGAALAAISRARPNATPLQAHQLDLIEAAARLDEGLPKAALEIANRAVERDPTCSVAARLKIQALQGLERPDEAHAFAAEAAKHTGDAEIARLARRASRGKSPPFEGWIPGTTTAGALAAELEWATRSLDAASSDEPMTGTAWACRHALPEGARLAFDVAMVIVADGSIRGPSANDRFTDLVKRWARTDASPETVFKLTALVFGIETETVIDAKRTLRALAEDAAPSAVITAFIKGVASANVPIAKALLALAGALLKRSELDVLQRAIRSSHADWAADALRSAVERELAPEFDVHAPPGLDELDDHGDTEPLPEAVLSALPPELRARVARLEAHELGPAEAERTITDVARFVEQKTGMKFSNGRERQWP